MDLAILVFSTIGNILLGLFVYFKNPHNILNKLFTALTASITLMLISNHFSITADQSNSVLFWIRLAMFFAVPFAIFFFLFVITFPKSRIPLSHSKIITILVLGLLTMAVALTPFLFSGVTEADGTFQPIPAPGIALFVITVIGLDILGSIILVRKFLAAKGVLKEQIKYILLGFFIFLGLLISSVFIAVNAFNVTLFVPLTPIYSFAFVAATSYAMVKHRLLDIRLIVARTLAYATLVLIIGIFFIGSTVTVTSFFLDTSTNLQQVILYAALTLIIAFIFQRLRRWLELITDRFFFKADYDSSILLSSLTKIMAETILIDDIASKLLQKIIFEMRITKGAFVLTDAGKVFVTETQGYKKNEEPKFSEKDIFALQALDKNLVFEDLEEGPAKDLLRKLNVTIVIPLKTQVDHVGLLLLGEKASGEIYSDKDIKVLEIFAPEAAISFENAKSVEKIRRFNITLKEQVDRATRDLKIANEQLKELDKLKDEFLSIASHDLRTPMTAIKGYLWMAINGRAGKIENPALKRYLDISYASSERMIQLINDLLNVSRIKAGRVQMVFESINLKDIVDQVFAELLSKASEKKILLKYEAEADLPNAALDKQRFPEVLQNLIGNALKFTPEGGKITVAAKKSKETGMIQVAVSDTGVGLSKEDAGKLFEKFGRIETSYAKAKESGGTGLGLYITKNYVDLHGGKIWVESELNHGTTFFLTLNIATPEIVKKLNDANQGKAGTPTVPTTTDSTVKEVAK